MFRNLAVESGSITTTASCASLCPNRARCRLQKQRRSVSVQCSSASFGGSRRGGKGGKARQPGLFEVKVITPPPRSLGIFALPPYTHNGEEIEIEGQGYVVTSLIMHYKLVKGKYVRDHSRLEVQPTGRYFLNLMLDNLVHGKYIGPTGQQD